MTKREENEINEQLLGIYCGIIYNCRPFKKGEKITLSYDFSNPIYENLLSKYPIKQIAGYGGDFVRALRLCRWLEPNLAHKGDFALTADGENGWDMDALALLDYSFGKADRGINCVAKAKILAACCLALGIYARRVGLYPYSPYDGDNHVVCEIFDRACGKWVMLDPTTGGYFTDGKHPLSVLKARELFADMVPVSAVLPAQRVRNLANLAERNRSMNVYYAKNLCYLSVETASSVEHTDGGEAYLVPEGFDIERRVLQNRAWYLAQTEEGATSREALERLKTRASDFTAQIGSVALWEAPF